MGWFKKNKTPKVSKPAAIPTPPRSTSISPEPATAVNGATTHEGYLPHPEADDVSKTSQTFSLSDAPLRPTQAHPQPAGLAVDSTANENTYQTPTTSPYITAQAPEPCTTSSHAHRLATCGHVVWTDSIQACASNCYNLPSKSSSKPTGNISHEAYACAACISAILRSKHIRNRRTFEAQMQKYQHATNLTEVVFKLLDVERESIWSADVLEAREMLESAGLECREMPLGRSLGVQGAVGCGNLLELATVPAMGNGRAYSRDAIPIDAIKIRAQVLLRSERTQARLKGFLY